MSEKPAASMEHKDHKGLKHDRSQRLQNSCETPCQRTVPESQSFQCSKFQAEAQS